MNERIRQLWEKSTGASVPAEGFYSSASKYNIEKFAELLIQECARLARATPCPYEDDTQRQMLGHTWDMAAAEAGSEIVKYFGVE